jgi:hypothetical protein
LRCKKLKTVVTKKSVDADFGEIALGLLQATGGRRANVQAYLTGVHFAIIGPDIGPDEADNGDVDFRKTTDGHVQRQGP